MHSPLIVMYMKFWHIYLHANQYRCSYIEPFRSYPVQVSLTSSSPYHKRSATLVHTLLSNEFSPPVVAPCHSRASNCDRSGLLVSDSAVHFLEMLPVNIRCCANWMIEGHLSPITLSNNHRAPSCQVQQRAITGHRGPSHSATQEMISRLTESPLGTALVLTG